MRRATAVYASAIVNCRLACYRFGLEETYGSDLAASRCPLVTWSLNTQRTLTRLYLGGAVRQSVAASTRDASSVRK